MISKKMSSTIRNIKLLCFFIMLVSLSGCMKDFFSGGDTDTTSIAFRVAARSGNTPEKARFIVMNLDKIIKNEIITKQDDENNGHYSLKLLAGEYRLIIVVNETEEMKTALNNAKSLNDLKVMQLTSSQREDNIVLISNNTIKVSSAGDSTPPQVAIDEGNPSSTPQIMLERAQAKTTLYVRKYTQKNGLAEDKVTIKKVSLCHLPKYSYLVAGNYTTTEFTEQILYNNTFGTLLENDVTETQYANKGKADEGAYTKIVAEIPDSNEPNNIFPEYLMQDPTKADAATYLFIEANYNTQGSNTEVTYSIPLRGNESIENYNLYRNHNYTVYLTLTQRGDFDAFEVAYNVQPWDDQEVNVDISKDPFLDITNVDVNVYDAAATRVYFFSNQPADKVFISPVGHIGTASGTVFEVQKMYHKLVEVNEEGNTEKADNFHYNFDNTSGTGKGYIDIIHLNTDKVGNDIRVINLVAGKLSRSINVSSIISEEAAKKNETPYAGTFHRSDERGERIVTWHNTGDWKATIRNIADFKNIFIDRLASPAFGKGLYTVQNPIGPEGAEVTDGTNGTGSISGKGRIYFRIGWKDFPANNKNRYAIIDVSYANNTKTQALYCRQGQEPEGLVTTGSLEMATYNVALPEEFTKYPTMAGYLYQWNDRTPYSPVGSVTNYNTTIRHDTFGDNRLVCPDGYGYPSKSVIDALDPILNNLDVHWGYYADGYFDRRAISNHAVNSSSINVAYAGNVFYNNSNGKSIFTPTTGARNEQGIFSLIRPGDEGKASMMSGFWANYSESPNNGVAVFQYSNKKSEVDKIDKLSALSVRCVRLNGYTIYFDANGGSGAPRSITKQSGEFISIPSAPSEARSNWHLCIAWNTQADGKGTTYKFGERLTISNKDMTLYAMWESMENLKLAPGSTSKNFIADDKIMETSYNTWTTVDEGNNGERYTNAADVLKELAYPYLQVSGTSYNTNTGSTSWDGARTLCAGLSPAGEWRLPRASELYWLYRCDNSAWGNISQIYPNASGTEGKNNSMWGVVPTNVYSFYQLPPGELDNGEYALKNIAKYFRCVREIRPLK